MFIYPRPVIAVLAGLAAAATVVIIDTLLALESLFAGTAFG